MNIHPKRFENLRARAALAGVELRAVRRAEDLWSFAVTTHQVAQEFDTLDGVEAWFTQNSFRSGTWNSRIGEAS